MATRFDQMNPVQLMTRAYAIQARLNALTQAEYEKAPAQRLVQTQATLCERYRERVGRDLF